MQLFSSVCLEKYSRIWNENGNTCDIAEGAEMGLETGSVPGLSCGLYGCVDFGEDYREVTGRLAVPEKLYVYVVPSRIRSLLKSWKTSFGSVFRTIPPLRNGYDT